MRTHSLRRSWFRAVAFVLVPVHVAMSAPAFAEVAKATAAAKAAAQASKPAPPPEVKVNRTVPKVTPPPLYPVFSAVPTALEITRARVFGEPLLAVGGTPSQEENAALASAISRWLRKGDPEDTSVFEHFLEVYPASPWRPSLAANLGVVYEKHGYFARADAKYRDAWTATKDVESPEANAVAEQSIAELLCMGMKFGKVEKLEELLADVGERETGGKAFEMIKSAYASAWELQHDHHRAIPSGPVALDRILTRVNPGEKRPKKISEFHATEDGASLAQIETLAREVDLPMRTGFRPFGGEIVVPSVAHLKAGHFSAIVREENGKYLLDDPLLGGEIWMSKGALEEESSGYFLIPEGPLPESWREASEKELASVRGKCQSTWGDPECDCFGKKSCPSGRCAPGMAQYQFVEHLASLLIQDSPVGYNPPRGPASFLQLTYHQRQVLQPTTFSFSNVGGSWSIGWVAWIEDNPANLLANVRTHLGNAGVETSFGLQGSTFAPASRSRAVLVRTSTSPIRYERRMADGSIEVFAQPDGAAAFPRRVMMTQQIDPQGNALTFTYDSQLRLVGVADAIGQVSTLSYDLASDPLKITRVSDPFGRVAKLEYDAAGRLVRIVDVIGMASSFEYGYGAFVRSMTTPYGTTTFASAQYGDIYGHPLQHWIQATDPMGATERMEYHYSNAAFPATEPASAVPTGFATMNASLNAHVTFYWDKRAWMLHPGDYSKAYTTKWLNGETWKIVDSKHSEKAPLENRIWYAYDGNPADGWVGPLHKRESKIGRVLDDGVSQIYRYERGVNGQPTAALDPLGRETRYQYNASALVAVDQRISGTTDYQRQLSYAYGTNNRPSSVTDAAGRTTHYTYNSSGQILSFTTPARAGITENRTTQYVYDPDGRLQQIIGPTGTVAVSYEYDSYGRPFREIDQDGYDATIQYDALDRALRIDYPDGTHREIVYDRLDSIAKRSRDGTWTRSLYDTMRRVVAHRDALDRVVVQRWCNCGSLEAIVDPRGNSTSWLYDSQGRVTQELRADNSATGYAYEATTSRIRTVTDALGQQRLVTYLADNSVQSIQYVDAIHATPSVTFNYDPFYRRLTSMTDGTGTTTFQYYATASQPGSGIGLLSTVDGPLQSDAITYTYDELGREQTRSIGGATTAISYDLQGRLAALATPLGTSTYQYDGPSGRISSVSLPPFLTTSFEYYDNQGDNRLQRIHNKKASGETISRFEYSYDPTGNVSSWTQQIASADPRRYSFRYDSEDQLTEAIVTSTDSEPEILKRYYYGYDKVSNRTSEQIDDVVLASAYDGMNRLASRGAGGPLRITGSTNEPAAVTINGRATSGFDTDFAGDQAIPAGGGNVAVAASDASGNVRTNTYSVPQQSTGQLLTYDAKGNLLSDGSREFYWDAESRLVKIVVDERETRIAYDGLGRRARVVEVQEGLIVDDRRFVWCGMELCQEQDAAGVVRKRFYADGVDVSGDMYVYARDHLASVREVIDASGNVRARYDYDPYGRTQKVSGDFESDFGYTGHMRHAATELLLTPHRAYDADLGRWLTPDPIGLLGGVNSYAYVGGMTISASDPLGLQAVPKGLPTVPLKKPPCRFIPFPTPKPNPPIGFGGRIATGILLVFTSAVPVGSGSSWDDGYWVCEPDSNGVFPEIDPCSKSVSGEPKSKKCSDELLEQLHAEVKKACGKPRACAGQGETCASVTAKIANGYACIAAREKMQRTCWAPGDTGYEGHMQQIAQAYQALRNCLAQASKVCK